jgi:hypothetical protein
MVDLESIVKNATFQEKVAFLMRLYVRIFPHERFIFPIELSNSLDPYCSISPILPFELILTLFCSD